MLTGGTGAGAAAAPGEVGIEFSAANVDRFTSVEAMQPAGAAILRLAWRHRACCWAIGRHRDVRWAAEPAHRRVLRAG